eukprot:CAMPEP_0172520320 /NCGR_PEP_ID=MMETSP1066-20121228/291933_1 /TAXON_ID=671091 /ORGANISM="Coscinodiscus wailesii, Strain CCMP2513" /LENGTH=261 /DNA_ID=CAMNT_0013303055 /DNA_START=200 /DNA_END=985 /DNA_ORIENTATION=-
MSSGCRDNDSSCVERVEVQDCRDDNQGFMRSNCMKSCGFCIDVGSYYVEDAQCIASEKGWGPIANGSPTKRYACNTYYAPESQWTLRFPTTQTSAGCKDIATFCDVSNCHTDKDYMRSNCMKSCGFCIDVGYYYQFRSGVDSTMCLDVKSVNAFTKLQLNKCNGTSGQKFRFDSRGKLYSQLSSSVCVEMDPRFGIFMHSACFDTWELIPNDQVGLVNIKNVEDAQCIASEKGWGPIANGSPTKRYSCNGAFSPESEWKLY